jgi:hypothetical protein
MAAAKGKEEIEGDKKIREKLATKGIYLKIYV